MASKNTRRVAPVQLEDIIKLAVTAEKSMSKTTLKDDEGLAYISDGVATSTAVHSLADDIKKLEQDIAELSLRVPRTRRRIKSIRIRF